MLLLYIYTPGRGAPDHTSFNFFGKKLKSYFVNGPMICKFHKKYLFLCTRTYVLRTGYIYVCANKWLRSILQHM